MSLAQMMVPEFEQEMATTRRLLERVPSDRGPWKPHPKSFAIGHLTQLVATMPGWIATTIRQTEINLASTAGYSFQQTESLLEQFDRLVRDAKEALSSATDADFNVPWSLKRGEQVLLTLPRGVAVRNHLSHLIHHRGQLSVYLRLIDVPVPSIYGPTADEKW
jgi:uncharacterized damage-inducible protein DinB